jgi:tRNA threonylcarbamoyladenosine biosynthesis protein TsaE
MSAASVEFVSRGEAETAHLGAILAATLKAGDVIALVGDLGAGKTRLVQAVAESMGVDRGEVTSPTFVLLQQYAGRLPIYHFDTYRLRDIDEFLELGAEEFLYADGVCLIEWGDRVEPVLPADHVRCEIEIAGKTERRFRFTGTGARSLQIVRELRDRL